MQIKKTDAAEAVKTLTRTEEVLKKKGWTKNSFKNWKGQVCFLQAVRDADGPGETTALILIHNCIGHDRIPDWNDDKERKLEDVLTVIAAARNIAQEYANEAQ
jgi:hypothetical protein